jgi:hypothetical protein
MLPFIEGNRIGFYANPLIVDRVRELLMLMLIDSVVSFDGSKSN